MFIVGGVSRRAVVVAIGVAVAVAVNFIGFGANIRTCQEIQWSPICNI